MTIGRKYPINLEQPIFVSDQLRRHSIYLTFLIRKSHFSRLILIMEEEREREGERGREREGERKGEREGDKK